MKCPPLPVTVPAGLLAALFLTGCGFHGLRHRQDDNPQVRAAQEAGLSAFGDRPVAGRSLDDFFRGRVGLITLAGRPLPIGRAVPVSRDGYYLTARHVVQDPAFRLSDTTRTGPAFRTREYRGRIVWQDEAADLALVKFDFRPDTCFPLAGLPPETGTAVFSGAGGRNSGTRILPANRSGVYDLRSVLDGGAGNGRFRTAGHITRLTVVPGTHPHRIAESTLTGRGGMSGGPVVNAGGHLTGILTGARTRWFSGPVTTFSLPAPGLIPGLIQEDRGLHR